jgi:chaperonin cofactor prefoldin
MVETQSNVRMADIQIGAKQMNIKRSQLVLKELSTLPEDVRVYKSIGRMFVSISLLCSF